MTSLPSIFFCLVPLPEHESRLAGWGKLKDDVEALAVFVHPGRADLCPEVFKDLEKDRVEMAWRNRIEELSDLIVARDRLDAEEGLSVIVSLTVVELALVLQKRRRLREKDAKGP